MRLTLARTDLVGALAHVARVVERRQTIPILSNVLLRAEGTSLRLRATDLDLEITTAAPAEVAVAGATTVPAATLHDIARKLPAGGQVTLETLQPVGSLTVKSGRARFVLQSLPESDFPDLSAGEMPVRFTLPAAELRRLIETVSFAISTEETRYYLNGIFLHVPSDDATRLRVVATDGHRLARAETATPEGAASMPGIIVPRKTIGEVLKLLGEGDVQVDLSATKIRFTIAADAGDRPSDGTTVMTSKLIDGTFPDYVRVIPTGNARHCTLDKTLLAAAVDRVATIGGERGRAVKLALADGSLTLSMRNPDGGDATEDLDVDYAGEPFEIGFNARYLGDVAAVLTGPTARLSFDTAASPTLIQDREGAPALFVLMPMRV